MFRGFLCGKRTEFFHTFAIAIEAEIPERLKRGCGSKARSARDWSGKRGASAEGGFPNNSPRQVLESSHASASESPKAESEKSAKG